MSQNSLLAALAVLLFSVSVHAVEPAELKPGLVAVYQDKATPARSVTRLEPGVALALHQVDSPHPRLGSLTSVRWKGHLNIIRGGKYTFSTILQGGKFLVRVGGNVVLQAEAGSEAVAKSGEALTLQGGVLPFEAEFTGSVGPMRVELSWHGPGFVQEPLPHQYLGHLPEEVPPSFAKDLHSERGRFLFEEMACVRCHKPAADDKMAQGLAERVGPKITEVAKRSYAGWIDAWLADPAKLRPNTTMPALFARDAVGETERFAVVKFLVSLAGGARQPGKAPTLSNNYRQSMERGKVLFQVTGCAACHSVALPKKAVRNDEEEKPEARSEDSFHGLGMASGPSSKYALGALGSKYSPEMLSSFLQDPLKVNPSGRMPSMGLSGSESQDLSRYLGRTTIESIEPGMPAGKGLKPGLIADSIFKIADAKPKEAEDFARLPEELQWVELGRKLVVSKGCVNCHELAPSGKTFALARLFPSLSAIAIKPSAGCLNADKVDGNVPFYALHNDDRSSIEAFLREGLIGAGSRSPTHDARVNIRRFNCLNCHVKDGEGGISVELSDQMRLLEKAENADDVRPPLLTGIGHKSRTPWLKAVLTQGGRARPWMQLRMPQYGEANIGKLPESLALLEGTLPDDAVRRLPVTATSINAGRSLIGKSGLGCISCHDLAGIPNTGTRGPDLATISQRVRFDWFERWLHQPLRMAPGTRMPQAFTDGKSSLLSILKGDPESQTAAMWSYLSLGSGLPLPEGMEPPRGLIIAVQDRPELLRTFLPEAGSRAIAVGYPGGISVAFSADECRLSYGWSGNFLDASPVWNNRGGAPAKLLGPKFWNAPSGHPWGLTASPFFTPDFLSRANNPAFGKPLPLDPPRVFDGPSAVRFQGYQLDSTGVPTFRYTLSEGNDELHVSETPIPVKSAVASGVRRKMEVQAPAGYRTWFLAGETSKDPRIFSDDKPLSLDLKPNEIVVPAEANRILLPTDDDRAIAIELTDAPKGTIWVFKRRPGGGWQALLGLPYYNPLVRMPVKKSTLQATFAITVWGLPKDDDALLNGLPGK